MCGIVGMLRHEGGVDSAILQRMVDIQKYRGPDGEGVKLLGRCGLGYCRLAILDLSEKGAQPMPSHDGRFWIVYNGEVYNYVELRQELEAAGAEFRGNSDTEVVVNAFAQWGRDCLHRFVGMWAFAIWDTQEETLFLAKDRFGIKPLYYREDADGFMFASEIKSLLALGTPRKPNEDIIAEFLVRGTRHTSSATFFEGVSQLPPGHLLTVNSDGIEMERYWDVSFPEADPPSPEQFYEAFVDSVRVHLRSDVPIGTCLSGGLDSSSIVSAASKVHGVKGWNAFSARFDDPAMDEGRWMELVVNETGAAHTEVWPSPEAMLEEMERLMWHQEEPFYGTSVYAQWCVMKAAGEKGVKVLLDGQGGDELLAGYEDYRHAYVASLLKRGRLLQFSRERKRLGVGWRSALSWALPVPLRKNNRDRWEKKKSRILGPRLRGTQISGEPHTWSNDPFEQRLAERLLGGGLQELLRFEDRNSMAHSVEARVPFLNHLLLDIAYSSPHATLFRGGLSKGILREAMRGTLVEAIRLRSDKLGFAPPEEKWFAGVLGDRVVEIVSDGEAVRAGYVDPEFLQGLIRDFTADGSRRLIQLLSRVFWLEVWLRVWIRDQQLETQHDS